jgi:hypothetical protein
MNDISSRLHTIWPPPIEFGDDDKRQAVRRPAALHGRLAYGGMSTGMVGCEVLDLSASGVRVETFVQLDELPETLSLEFDGTYSRARRCWADGRQIGLEFIADDVQSIESK